MIQAAGAAGTTRLSCFLRLCFMVLTTTRSLLAHPDIAYNSIEDQVKGIPGNDEEERIVGGVDAQPGRYSHQVALYSKDGTFICGGSIITTDIIVTAAHCTDDVDVAKIGVYDRTDDTTAETMEICDKVNHPSYGSKGKNDDIGLLRLCKSSELASKGTAVKTIQLNDDPNVPADDQILTVTGWGATSEYGYLSKILQQVNINYIPEADCAKVYKLSDSMMCAGVKEGGKDACLGDSGGPIIVEGSNSDNDVLVGVVSWGVGCAEPGFPGVYTRVSYELDWILEQACELSKTKPCGIRTTSSSSHVPTQASPVAAPMNPSLAPNVGPKS